MKSRPRPAGIVPLSAAIFFLFWVWLTPANKYAFDGPTTIPPDPDTVLMLTLLSIVVIVFAALAASRSRRAEGPAVRRLIAGTAAVLTLYAVFRLMEALPHFQG